MAPKLGQILVQERLISLQQLQAAQDDQRKTGDRLGHCLTKLGFIQEQDLVGFLSRQYGVPSIDLREFDIPPELVRLVPRELAVKHRLMPVNRAGSILIVAMADPSNIYAVDDLKFRTGYTIEVVVASEQAILDAVDRHYNAQIPDAGSSLDVDAIMDEAAGDDVDFGPAADASGDVNLDDAMDAPVVRLCNALLLDAVRRGASDIHLEPYEKDFRVRFRVDGMLQEVMKPPLRLRNAMVARLKVMADLDIAERRLPQDGRMKLRHSGREMDFRVSVLPCLYGEKVVLRLLDKTNLQLDMTKLGFEAAQLEAFMAGIRKPYGMCLVTGPTGSGKTTTLYSALSALNQAHVNISTAEDPVEFNFAGINQVQVNEGIGLSFAGALRAFLRQDPNIIMVGEIRDYETAETAVKASLTGHMVLSTLHTNDAPSTVTRLLNMGVEPFLVAASVNVIVAQRLARRLCPACRKEREPAADILRAAQVPDEKMGSFPVYSAVGCTQCSGTGFKGRVALYEVLSMTDAIRQSVLDGASTADVKMIAMESGMQTLRMSAVNKLIQGVTSVEEVLRVSAADDLPRRGIA